MNIMNNKLSFEQLVNMFDYDFKKTVVDNIKPYTPSTKISPSSLGGCLRENYYKITGTPQDFREESFELHMIQEDGSFTHDTVQRYLKEYFDKGSDWQWVDAEEYVKEKNIQDLEVIDRQGLEVKFYSKRFNANFLCDGIILHKPTNTYFVLEIKTEVSMKFNRRKEIESKHVIQGAFYATVFDIDNILFYYINRDFKSTKPLPLTVTPEMKKDLVIVRIEYLLYARDNKILPPRISDNIYSDKRCQYCKYKTACANNLLGGANHDGVVTPPEYELKEQEAKKDERLEEKDGRVQQDSP